MPLRRVDSLLSRLLLAQVGLLASALLIFGALVVTERNELAVQLYAESWAMQIATAAKASRPENEGLKNAAGEIHHHDTLPPGLKLPVTRMPAAVYLTEEMARRGVHIDDVRIDRTDGRLTVWVHVLSPDTPPLWLSNNGPAALLPHWSKGVFYGVGLLCLLIGAVSWRFTRRVTHPLRELRVHMQAHARHGIQPGDVLVPLQASQAPPELIAIDAAYRQLAERLQRNERERALLLAGVSHDLRSPLSRIRLAAEMLPESAGSAAGVASITRNVDHADRLIASFLEFIRTGTVALNQTVDVAAVARQAVRGFERPAGDLSISAPDSLLLQRAHGLLVERLIVNLVDNALKHGGLPVAVEVRQHGDAVHLSVSDAGPGLPPGDAGRLLEAFARGDASRGVPGFGLGLTISQQIVVRLQGELSFDQAGLRHRVRACLPMQR